MHSVHSFRSLSALLILALLLAAPWPVLARPFESPRAEATASPMNLFIDWLAGLWGDNGCSFDPNGLCRDSSASEPPSGSDGLDNGCSFDPSGGGCRKSVDAGCTFDPSGSPCRDGR